MPLLAVSIDYFCNVKAQRYEESEFFYSGQVASGDLSGRTHARTDPCTDNCKINIIMIRNDEINYDRYFNVYCGDSNLNYIDPLHIKLSCCAC